MLSWLVKSYCKMEDIRDLLKHLNIIRDQDYDQYQSVRNLSTSEAHYPGRTEVRYHLNRDSSTSYTRWLTDRSYVTDFKGKNGAGYAPYHAMTRYIMENGEAFGIMRDSYRDKELDGNHVYITGNLVCVHYNKSNWDGQGTCRRVAIYHRDDIDVTNVTGVKNNIIHHKEAIRYIIRNIV